MGPRPSLNPQYLPQPVREKDFQGVVIKLAEWCGWLQYHTLNFSPTPSASKKGFPDLVLAKGGRLWFVELKRSRKVKLDPWQVVWRDALIEAGQVWKLWVPEDWEEIEKLLAV
jgi:hypothetical protein